MNSTTPILCPLVDRRTKTELLIKLFVVHFTTIGAFFHLLNIRKESLITWRPILYIIAPITFIVHHALALVCGAFQVSYLCMMEKRPPNWKDEVVRPLQCLLGVIRDSNDVNYSQLPSRVSAREDRRRSTPIRWFGHLLAVLVFAVQCCLSILLYLRRRQHAVNSEATTIADQRTFELATGGLLAGLLTLGVVLHLPICNSQGIVLESDLRIADPADAKMWKFGKTVILLGDRCLPGDKYITIDDRLHGTNHVTGRLWLAAGICSLVLLAQQKLNILPAFHSMHWSNFWSTEKSVPTEANDGFLESSIEEYILLFTVMLAPFIALANIIQAISSYESGSAEERDACDLGSRRKTYIGFCLFSPVIIVITIVILFWGVATLSVLLVGLREYLRLSREASEFKTWPQDKACPMLWKDPMADWVWWLA